MVVGEDGFLHFVVLSWRVYAKMYERHNQDLILSYKSFSK